MATITAIENTAAKPSAGQFVEVGGTVVYKGQSFETENLKRVDAHYVINNTYFYAPHFQREKNCKSVSLNLPCHLQRNNLYAPSGSCAHTSAIMCMGYLGVTDIDPRKQLQMEDEFYELMKKNGVKRGYHDDIANLINKKFPKIEAKFSTEVTYSQLRSHLSNGNPAYISGKFTRSGHIIAIRGYDDDRKKWLVNDPFGEHPAYSNHNGCNLEYSYNKINTVSYGGSNSCWAMLFRKR